MKLTLGLYFCIIIFFKLIYSTKFIFNITNNLYIFINNDLNEDILKKFNIKYISNYI